MRRAQGSLLNLYASLALLCIASVSLALLTVVIVATQQQECDKCKQH
jgi:hypothetical protein